MRVRIIQIPDNPQMYRVQYKNWWNIFWVHYTTALEADALEIAVRLKNPFTVEIKE